MKKLMAGGAVAVLALGPIAAHATATSIATLSGFTVTLIDLDPDDGIAPSISWAASSPGGSFILARADDAAGLAHQSQVVSTQLFNPGALDEFTAVAQGRSSIVGTLADGLTFNAQGLSLGSNADYEARADAGSEISGLRFTLSPHTLATFSGSIDLFAQTTYTSPLNIVEFAHATAVVKINGSVGVAGSFAQSVLATCIQVQAGCVGQTISRPAIPLALTYRNDGAVSADGSVHVSMRIGGDSMPAVPEPASGVLMLAGLAALLWRRSST